MADGSKIEWTEATWNPITGCSVCSAGCKHCYAMKLAGTRMKHHPSRAGLTVDSKAGPVWTGEVRFNEGWLMQPIEWSRPRDIFVNAHGDTFHEGVPDEWIDRMFAVMALAPQHRFQVLTKRSARMRDYLNHPAVSVRIGLEALGMCMESKRLSSKSKLGDGIKIKGSDINPGGLAVWPIPNVWAGVSVEDQENATRLDDLRETPAAVRWVSAEPLLGPLDLKPWLDMIDWVVVGGESDKGPSARPMHPDWSRVIRDDCALASVPFLFKQHGDWREFFTGGPEVEEVENDSDTADSMYKSAIKPAFVALDGRTFKRSQLPEEIPCRLVEHVGKVIAGRELDGRTHDGMPA